MPEATPAAVPVAPPAISVRVPGFVIDLARDELRTMTGALVDLRPRSFAVLRLLALHAGRMVTKDAIMDAVVTLGGRDARHAG